MGVVLHHQRDLGRLRIDFDLRDIEAAALGGFDGASNVLLAEVAWCPLTCHGAVPSPIMPVSSSAAGRPPRAGPSPRSAPRRAPPRPVSADAFAPAEERSGQKNRFAGCYVFLVRTSAPQ